MIRLSAMRVSTSDRTNNLPMTAGEGEVIIAGGRALNATSQLPEQGNHQNVTKTKKKQKKNRVAFLSSVTCMALNLKSIENLPNKK